MKSLPRVSGGGPLLQATQATRPASCGESGGVSARRAAPQAVLAALLADVHRRIGALEQAGGLVAVHRRQDVANRQADAAGVARQREGLAKGIEQRRPEVLRLLVVV